MSEMLRILGCAFAAADLLFEASPDGKVAMALGAGQRVRGKPEAALVGEDWLGWIAPADRGMVRAMSNALKPGERRGWFSRMFRRGKGEIATTASGDETVAEPDVAYPKAAE